ncbi:MAG: AAA family ATPase [Methylophilus sp.]|nr:AAA family ATPase [Methylophilus sp.]
MSTTHKFNLVDHQQLVGRVEELKHRHEDIKSKVGFVLKQLWDCERELRVIQDLSPFDSLKIRFPNFIEVIEYYEVHATALKNLNLPFETNPILLLGDPGLGKTFFVAELAKSLQLPLFEICMNITTASFAISGGSLQWGDGAVGFIAKSIAACPIGNPIFMIDEVDKSNNGNGYNPINPLYNLLETHSASKFKDEALELELDVSKVIWILTANQINNIPEPIISRMKVFQINRPGLNDMPNIVESIYSKIRKDKSFGNILSSSIDSSVINSLIGLSPREIKMTLENAVMSAVIHRRTNIINSDLDTMNRRKYHAIGFY